MTQDDSRGNGNPQPGDRGNPHGGNPGNPDPGNPHGDNPGTPSPPDAVPSDRGAGVPVGTVTMYAGVLDTHTIPALAQAGWLPCDGMVLFAKDYPELFAAIGTSHGGDGIKFCVPDLRGTFVRGVDGGRGKDPDANRRLPAPYGGNGGDRVGSVQEDALGEHAHSVAHLPTALHWAVDEANIHHVAQWNDGVGVTGVAGEHETRPRNVALHFIIRFRKS
jgi:microcystin-dependent protein